MRTIAFESRAYVLSANQCQKRKHLPTWITDHVQQSASSGTAEQEDYVSRGGSCIISPDGSVLAGPIWETDEDGELLSVEVDFEECERGRLDLDLAGSYGRGDVFKLEVKELDISPPP